MSSVSDFRPHFAVTGVGSVPFDDPNEAVDLIREYCTIPYWPQLSAARPAEDMSIQYTEGLPLIKVDLNHRSLSVDVDVDRADALAGFYEKVFAGATEAFAISEEFGSGLYAFLRRLEKDPPSAGWVKGQVVGPFTLASVLRRADGLNALSDPELLDALAQGLAMKAVWQVKKFEELGQRAIVFFDEPTLTGFGSAFSTLDRNDVIQVLSETFAAVRQHVEVKIGVHCCGNTDWSMLVETGLDIVNVDSYGYGQSLLLYPEALSDLYARGGLVAWGATPTLNYTGEETVAGLWAILKDHLDRLKDQGLNQEAVAESSLVTPACSVITPACGMASCSAQAARRIHQLNAQVAEMARNWV